MKLTAEQKITRTDLFAVLVYEDQGWTIKHICLFKDRAKKLAAWEDTDKRNFPLVKSKVRHPIQQEVSVFLAVGNVVDKES